MTQTKLSAAFHAARLVSTPLVAIQTSDPAATIAGLHAAGEFGSGEEGSTAEVPVFRWDVVRGLVPVNPPAHDTFAPMLGDLGVEATGDLVTALAVASRAPKEAIVLALNVHRLLEGEKPLEVIQAIWNLRDLFKQDFRMLVLLCPAAVLPPEIAQDVVVLDEPLPSDPQLAGIVRARFEESDLLALAPGDLNAAVAAVRGLGAFPAEQVVAMSLTKRGLNLPALWERKKSIINQCKGLRVDRGTESFADIEGIAQIKALGEQVIAGQGAPSVIVRFEEFEKAMAGAMGEDGTGVSQDALSVILEMMEDNNWTGLIASGVPGCAKTLFTKALANAAGALPIRFDLNATKGRYVGQSEAAVRQAMQTIEAAAGPSGAFFVATANRLKGLPPELIRRFRMGIWFFDLPTPEEQDAIWGLQLRKHDLKPSLARPDDLGWTGADIRNCCEIAWRLRIPLTDAAQYLVPVSKSDPQSIEAARDFANGRFLSASYPGVYRKGHHPTLKAAGRAVRVSS